MQLSLQASDNIPQEVAKESRVCNPRRWEERRTGEWQVGEHYKIIRDTKDNMQIQHFVFGLLSLIRNKGFSHKKQGML